MFSSSRGQLYSTDALLSLIVFAFALTLSSGILSQIISQSDVAISAQYREQAGDAALHTLLVTGGEPFYWNFISDKNNVQSVGLMDTSWGISTPKWNAFKDWNANDYYLLKSRMGIPDQNFYLTISDTNKTVLDAVGISPQDKNEVTVIIRPSIFNGNPVMVQIQVYR